MIADGELASSDKTAATASAATARLHSPIVLWALAATLLAIAVAYRDTFWSIGSLWLQSDTFIHGFLIVPISVYLVWRRWPAVRQLPMTPSYSGLPLLALCAAGWWLSHTLGVQLGQQLFAVTLVPAAIYTMVGRQVVQALAFPLAYLYFAVPFGEGFVPYLIDFTASFVVWALQATGFSVFRDGRFFSIPSGDFEVAKACSGVRYLLASLAVGTLYAYLAFRSIKKRVAVVLLSLVLPIVANGVRAYGIVLLAHYSDMRLAVGVDHFIFGWVFFGFVMFLMFWICERYRDLKWDDRAELSGSDVHTSRRVSLTAAVIIAAAASVLAIGGPLAAGSRPDVAAANRDVIGLPDGLSGWPLATSHLRIWVPHYSGAAGEAHASYSGGDGIVDASVYTFDQLRQGEEMASSMHQVADPTRWVFGTTTNHSVETVHGRELKVEETLIQRVNSVVLVWVWREVNGLPVQGAFETKAREAMSLLKGERPLSVAALAATDASADVREARALLEDFAVVAGDAIYNCLSTSPVNRNCAASIPLPEILED